MGVLLDPASQPLWGPPYAGNNAHFLAALVAFGSIMLLSNVRHVVYQFMQKRELELGVKEFSGIGRSAQSTGESVNRYRIERGSEFGTAMSTFKQRVSFGRWK